VCELRRLLLITEIIAPYRIPVFNELARVEGLDLHVVFLSETDPTLRDWLVYRDEIKFTHTVLPSFRIRIGKHNVLLNRELAASLSSFHPDVIICGGYNYPAAWQALVWARQHRVPFLLWCESNSNDRRNGYFGIEFLKRAFIRSCSGFVVPGTSSFNFIRSFGVPAQNILVAPNAVDVEFFAQAAENARNRQHFFRQSLRLPARYFLFVGRLTAAKGVFDLLTAYAELDAGIKSTVSLVFAGDGSAKKQLQKLASAIAPGLVFFPGFVQRETLPIYYAFADALVLPSYSEPWGLVVNEGMSCGLPIIVSDVAGCAPDLVRHTWNGFLVPPGDIAAITNAMKALATQAELRQEFGARSMEHIQQFSPANCAAGFAAAAGTTASKRSFARAS